MPVVFMEHELVTQDVDLPSSSPYLNRVDLAIPTGKQVVGSGALVTHVWDQSTETRVPVDSLTGVVPSQVDSLRVSTGPHPTDSTKWRVMLSVGSGIWQLRVRCWIATVG